MCRHRRRFPDPEPEPEPEPATAAEPYEILDPKVMPEGGTRDGVAYVPFPSGR